MSARSSFSETWLHTSVTMTSVILFDVEIEPSLHILQGETFANKSNITVGGVSTRYQSLVLFESRFSRTFCEVRIFNLYPKSYLPDF